MKRKILITGATGLVGAYFLSRVISSINNEIVLMVRGENHDVARQRIAQRLQYFDLELSDNVDVYCGDLTRENLGLDTAELARIKEGLTDIFHAAALISFNDRATRGATSQTNIEGTKNLLQAFADCPCNMFYISTAYVAGDVVGEFYEDQLNAGQGFKNDYEFSKFTAENYVREFYRNRGPQPTVIRPSIVLGEYDSGRTFQFESFYKVLHIVAEYALKGGGKELNVHYNDDSTQNYIPVDYLTDMIVEIFNDSRNWGKTYHLTNDQPLRNCDMPAIFKKLLDIEINNTDELSSRFDRIFSKKIRAYAPYLESEPVFDRQNLAALKSSCRETRCDYSYISRILNYSLDTDWGRKCL